MKNIGLLIVTSLFALTQLVIGEVVRQKNLSPDQTAGEFYDLTTDAREWHDLYAKPERRAERDRMSAELIAHLNGVALKKAIRPQ